jgi:hypothetical protein
VMVPMVELTNLRAARRLKMGPGPEVPRLATTELPFR